VPLALGTERPLDPFDPAARLADLDLVETDGGIEKGNAQPAPIGELFGGFQFRLVLVEAVRRAARSESGKYSRLARLLQLLPHPRDEEVRDDPHRHLGVFGTSSLVVGPSTTSTASVLAPRRACERLGPRFPGRAAANG